MATTNYKQINSRIIEKYSVKKKLFFLKIATAIRISDREKGLLIQHVQKTNRGYKKQGASFFVRQRDLPSLLVLLHSTLNLHKEDLGTGVQKYIKDQLGFVTSGNLLQELSKMEDQLRGNSGAAKLDELQELLSVKDEQISTLAVALAKARSKRQEIRVVELERRIPEFKSKLSEFNHLLENGRDIAKQEGKKQESLFQDFLNQNFWMFGVSYVSIENKPRSGKNHIPDLLLQRADGFNDVVELENPTDRLFVKKGKRYEQSGELKEALAQTMDYLDDYAVGFKDEYYETQIDTYKPNGIVVIGRALDKELERRRRQLNSYLHGIEIWTYDDLVKNAEQVISLLERGPLYSE